ncbi:mCG140562, partial [Mus musculus]
LSNFICLLVFLRQGLCVSPGWPGTRRNPSASASQVLRMQMHVIIPSHMFIKALMLKL